MMKNGYSKQLNVATEVTIDRKFDKNNFAFIMKKSDLVWM